MSSLEYHVVDVFTDRAYAGNPLAVVLDADELAAPALQAIAREFNLSETAFPMRASDEDAAAGADYRLRIFTPAAELPFAGHPSVGAAWVLAHLGRVPAGDVAQACGAGVLPLRIEPGPGRVELTGATPAVGGEVPVTAALAACGLGGDAAAGRPVRLAGTGLDFAYLLVADDAVARAAPDLDAIGRLAGHGARGGLSVAAWDPATRTAHTRVFAGDVGVPEDPATGSAALGFGAYGVAEGLLPADGESSYTVLQGIEMGRPSRLDCTVVARGGVAVACRVAGGVAPVATGRITVPAA